MAFHLRKGLFFERLEGNYVRIFQQPPGEDPTFEVTVPATEWASVIASVSARGETAETWQEALTYHTSAATA